MPATAVKAPPTKPETDNLEELRQAHDDLDTARQEHARLSGEARTFEAELQGAQAGLDRLARDEHDQFGPDGQPKPKTLAAELRDKLVAAESTRWLAVLEGAKDRLTKAEAKVRRLTDQHAAELARREFRAGEDDLAELDDLAERALAVLSRVQARADKLLHIASACGGRIDGRAVLIDDRLAQLGHLLGQHAEFRPPRIPILTPFTHEEPTVVRGRGGGWIKAAHGSDNYADEQPPKLEPRR